MSNLVKFKGGLWERCFIQEGTLQPQSNQKLSGGADGGVLDFSIPSSSQYALIALEGNTLRWRDDGGVASANFTDEYHK